MAKKYVTGSVIDNLTFYTYGRLEREIEGLAERTGVPKSDFTGRLSALLGNTSVWPILGNSDPMPALPQETESAGVHLQQPTLALGEPAPSHHVHHGQDAKTEVSARRKVALKLMGTMESPVFSGEFHKQMIEKGRMTYAAAHTTTTRMILAGILVKHGMGPMAKFSWERGQESATEEATGRIGKAAANRALMQELMRNLTSPLKKSEWVRLLANSGLSSSTARNFTDRQIRKGVLKQANGMISWGTATALSTQPGQSYEWGQEKVP